jgi:hypothetical protein
MMQIEGRRVGILFELSPFAIQEAKPGGRNAAAGTDPIKKMESFIWRH